MPQFPNIDDLLRTGTFTPSPSPNSNNKRGDIREALKKVLYSLSEGLSARANAGPGARGQIAQVAASLAAPFKMREMEEQKRIQEQQRQFEMARMIEMIRQGKVREALDVRSSLAGAATPTMTVPAPQATPMAYPGQAGPGPTMGGGAQQVAMPNPNPQVPGYPQMSPPENAQQKAMRMMEEFRMKARAEQDAASPPAPRNIDPLSPAGIAAQQALRVPTQRNIDPLSAEGIAAQQALRPPEAQRNIDPLSPAGIAAQKALQEAKATTETASPYATERSRRTVESVDALMKKVNRSTVGMGGTVLGGVPETEARNFRAELDTLKANIAFNELTAMREASKTGGALGQVSNVELGLLQSALGALDIGQSPENFKAQLKKIRDSVERWQKAAQPGGQNQGGGMVNITLPDGRSGQVPSDKLSEAIKRGAKVK